MSLGLKLVRSDSLGNEPGFCQRRAWAGVTFAPSPVRSFAMTDGRDTGLTLDPRYDAAGLVTAVVTDRATGELLMVAHMNAQALTMTRESGLAHFWSRSRNALWKKGETSGNMLRVVELRIDCDQDCLWLIVEPAGPACHTGARSCFFRRITPEGLERVD